MRDGWNERKREGGKGGEEREERDPTQRQHGLGLADGRHRKDTCGLEAFLTQSQMAPHIPLRQKLRLKKTIAMREIHFTEKQRGKTSVLHKVR